jgi:TetR/AcrR family transcriptional regulator, transcriptional repressor for nem operon
MTTADTILDVAADLIQSLGYNGFSFQDVADRVGIRKASLHHHFATKAALGEALIDRYRQSGNALLGEPTGPGHRDKLEQFLAIFGGLAQHCRQMCLMGMLAAEFQSLPEAMQQALARTVAEFEGWLAALIADGCKAGAFRFTMPAPALAATILATLEGGLLIARFGPSADRMAANAAVVRGLLGLTEEGRQQ